MFNPSYSIGNNRNFELFRFACLWFLSFLFIYAKTWFKMRVAAEFEDFLVNSLSPCQAKLLLLLNVQPFFCSVVLVTLLFFLSPRDDHRIRAFSIYFLIKLLMLIAIQVVSLSQTRVFFMKTVLFVKAHEYFCSSCSYHDKVAKLFILIIWFIQ